jgi:hypothetical protein
MKQTAPLHGEVGEEESDYWDEGKDVESIVTFFQTVSADMLMARS